MADKGGLVHITNFPLREATDGGSQREKALADFVTSRGGTRLTVQDKGYHLSKTARFTRLPRLLKQVAQLRPDVLVLDYPSYPFLWQHKVTPYFLCSLLFTARLRHLADRQGFRVVVDVMDLPAFQYADLGFALSMKPRTLQWFDRFTLGRADQLWVCSGSIARLIHESYGIDRSRIIVALNGYSECAPAGIEQSASGLKVAYAGSLNRERGIEPMIDAFLSVPDPSELHLCGSSGEWIPERYTDQRVVYHGALSDGTASDVLSDCQLGLIPYPEKGYYNIAFATKLAFYLGIGLPVLCSDVAETGEYVRNMGVGLCSPVADFPSAISYVAHNPDQLRAWRRQVMSVRGLFSWRSVYTMALEESLRRGGAAPA